MLRPLPPQPSPLMPPLLMPLPPPLLLPLPLLQLPPLPLLLPYATAAAAAGQRKILLPPRAPRAMTHVTLLVANALDLNRTSRIP